MAEKNKICEICKKKALYICFQCKKYYCEECNKYVHNIEINSQHKKEKIDSFKSIDINCPEHSENQYTFFCADDKGKI